MIKIIITILASFLLVNCGGNTHDNNIKNKYSDGNYTKVSISGDITYDLVPANQNHIGLDYSNIRHEPSRWISLEAIDEKNILIEKTSTDLNGHYIFNKIPINTKIKIRILALINKNGIAKVVNNTKNNALYAVDGSLVDSGSKNTSRDINIPSGWMGENYNSTRSAAPFAILGSVQKTMKLVIDADPSVAFSNLNINWSKNNIAYSGDASSGKIGTSHYVNNNLYILGDENGDTDEYDDHVITHEWGHYYIDHFSRSDSIGGAHNIGELLDIRVAFSEGFCNAFSAISLHDSIYSDSMYTKQSSGIKMDIENGEEENPGWFSEASVQHIIYDLFDKNQDKNDNIELDFYAFHHVFTSQQKYSPAFTSLFSFITSLKEQNQAISSDIDSLVSSENISTINDIYGSNRTNHPENYPYKDLTLNLNTHTCVNNLGVGWNKLGNRSYVKFIIQNTGNYLIKIKESDSPHTNGIFVLHQTAPSYRKIGYFAVSKSHNLSKGTYIMDIYDEHKRTCYDIHLEAI